MPNENDDSEFQEELVQNPQAETTKIDLDETKALVLSKVGQHRANIKKILHDQCELETDFIDECNAAKVLDFVKTHKCSVLIHDWDGFTKNENHRLHQRLAKSELAHHLIRLIYSALITSDIHALISDVYLVRVTLTASLKISISGEINSARFSLHNLPPLQSEVIAIRNKQVIYSQKKMDRIVEEGMKNYPHDPLVRLEHAFFCYRQNNLQEAEEIAVTLLKQNPRNVRVLTLIALILMKKGLLEEAGQILEQANFLAPQNSFRLVSLGEIFNAKGDKKKARDYLQESIEADPSDHEAVSSYAKFEIAEGNTGDAVRLFQRNLSDQAIAGMLNNTAVQYVKEQKNDEAIAFYQLALEALVTDHYRHAVFFNLALVYKRLKQYEKALLFLKKALELKPDFEKAIREERLIEELERFRKTELQKS